MRPFEYASPSNLKEAISALDEEWEGAMLIAGGTDLIGEMKERVISPKRLVNLKSAAGLKYIEHYGGGLKIGALTTISQIEADPTIQDRFAVLSNAAGSIATLQIRNVATLGGNLCQRPRCWYYRSTDFPCLKKGGDICYAIEGENKYHAILGVEPDVYTCHIVHPSDMAPALVALGASAKIEGRQGSRIISLEDFFTMPDGEIFRENVLKPGEILTEIGVPNPKPNTRSLYLKLQEKGSMDFALVSVAVVLTLEGKVCRDVRIVFGGVAERPFRSEEAENVLRGKTIDEPLALKAAEAATKSAEPLRDNGYKVDLAKAALRKAILSALKA